MSLPQSAEASAVQSVATALTIVQFMAEWTLVKKIVHEKDASRYSWAPAFGLLLTATFWLGYGSCVLPTPQVLTVNAFGALQALAYLGIFVIYSRDAGRRSRIIICTVAYCAFVAMLFGFLFGLPGSARSNAVPTVSIILIIINTSLWGSPLQALWAAFKVLSLQRVSVPLSVLQLICAALWAQAGILLSDLPLTITSSVGCILSAVQVMVIVYIALERRRRQAAGLPLPEDGHMQVQGAKVAAGGVGDDVENQSLHTGAGIVVRDLPVDATESSLADPNSHDTVTTVDSPCTGDGEGQ